MYVCIYNFLWMILILSLWSELLEVRWQSLANSVQIQNLLISLSLRNKIILSKLEALVCESYGLLFAWSPLRHYLGELLVKKWYKTHILLG